MMATQTPSRRQAAAKRAAATRKRNSTKRSASATKASARRTQKAATAGAKQTTREARRTTRQAGRTTGRGLDSAGTTIGAIGRQAQRAVLIQLGAAATVGEKVKRTARTYSSLDGVVRELDRFERRGARALNRRQRVLLRRRRELQHEARGAGRSLESRADGLRADAKSAAQQVTRLV